MTFFLPRLCHVVSMAVTAWANSSFKTRKMSTGVRSLSNPLSIFHQVMLVIAFCTIKLTPSFMALKSSFSTQEVTNPVSLLREFVHARDSVHGLRLPLFLREDGSHPTHAWFDTKLFTFVDRSFGGHLA
ncbi:hypothetical protein BYT27DRAFT_7294754 [Phlegmacium glaucopus]|nr:hypothetical protein BYT27DRAFT_7294754 [Phlegmacium glaucopus]